MLFIGFMINPINVTAQSCAVPTGLNSTNVSNFTATLNWTLDSSVDHYRLRYREVGALTWEIITSPTGVSHDISGLTASTTYEWQARAYCSADNTIFSGWTTSETFTTTNDPVDCNNTPNGTAVLDNCTNCVGGNTGAVACIAFTPTVNIALSTTECNAVADIVFTTSQDPNEPDIETSVFTSSGGAFDFSGLAINDVIGSSTITLGSTITGTTTLMVNAILTANKISVKAVDNATGLLIGTFTIENSGGGILIDATSPGDNNNITNGNNQTILLNGLFVNPAPSVIAFTSTLNSELGDLDIQNTSVTIACLSIYGCTDPIATNYDAAANTDDGSCTYAPSCPQLGDANCDNVVNLTDLTLVINNWLQSTSVGQNGDVVGSLDGAVNLADLTLVINNWLQSTP